MAVPMVLLPGLDGMGLLGYHLLVPAVDQARLMAALTPHATMRVLDGHGHLCLIAPDVDLGITLDEWTDA
jgi:hypothetical protein